MIKVWNTTERNRRMSLNQSHLNNIKPKSYFYEISFIRAIACLLVLMVHVTAEYYYLNGRNFNWLTYFSNQISRFGTPTFAVASV